MGDYGAFGRRVMYSPLTDIPDYGLSPMTDATQAGMPNAAASLPDPSLGEQSLDALLRYGPMPAKLAVEIAKQPYYAGEAVGEAAFDPTLPNITNAGFQSALALAQPMKGLGVLGAGYGLAGASDAGFSLFDDANAKPKKKNTAPESKVAEMPGLTPEQQAEYADAVRKIERGAFTSGAERRSLEKVRDRLSDISAAYQTTVMTNEATTKSEAARKEREEYDRAVLTAEEARDKELGRVRRFSDTEVGKLFDKTGGFAPFAVATGLGMLSRGASGATKGLAGHASNVGGGAFAGAMVPNVPLAYNAFFTEPDNPERAAYMAYSRELPQGHPRKDEMAAYAKGLPEANPVRTEAAKELYDPTKAMERMGLGAVEGVAGWYAGKHGWDVPSRLSKKAGEAFSRRPQGPSGPGPTKPTGEPKPRLPKSKRQALVNKVIDEAVGVGSNRPRAPKGVSAEVANRMRSRAAKAVEALDRNSPNLSPGQKRDLLRQMHASGVLKLGAAGVPASAVLDDMLSRMEPDSEY